MTRPQPQHLQARIRLPSLPKGRASGCRRTKARKMACKNGPSILMISRPSPNPQNQSKRCQNLNRVLALSRAARFSFQATSNNNSRLTYRASSRPTNRVRASRQHFAKAAIEAASRPATMSARQKASSCPNRSKCLLKPQKPTQTIFSLSRNTRCISIPTYYPITSQAAPRPRRRSALRPSSTT